MAWDERTSAALRLKQQRGFLWKSAAFFAHSGDSWFWMAGLVLVWLVARGAWHPRAALMALGVGSLAVLVIAIKFTIRRQRPEGEWGAVYRNTDPHSFPAGHAARAAMLAVLAALLGPPWFGWLVCLWAPVVSLARVGTGVHYISDVLAGIAMGLLYGWGLWALLPVLQRLLPWLF